MGLFDRFSKKHKSEETETPHDNNLNPDDWFSSSFARLRFLNLVKETVLMFVISLLLMVSFASCTQKSHEQTAEYEHPAPPVITVCFVPLDGVNSADIKKVSVDFASKFASRQWEPYIIQVLEASKIPDSCFNSTHTRYSASKVISFLENKYAKIAQTKAMANSPDNNWAFHIIGVTDRDISASVHGKADYGILGLSYLNNSRINSSIISTYRIRRKKDLWKLAVHEFCHGFYNAPHCYDDHCIMCDAKGGNPHYEIKDSLCVNCASFCLYED